MGRDRSQVAFSQVREVRSVSRGFGAWGDMVLVLTDGSRLELRSVPRFRELEAFIEERIRARRENASEKDADSKGFAA